MIQKVILPPRHIKLGHIKDLVKAMNKDSPGFKIMRQKFLSLSEAKINEGILEVRISKS